MLRRLATLALAFGLIAALSGCGLFTRAERPAWRAKAEQACLATGRVKAAPFMQPASARQTPHAPPKAT